MLRRTVEDTPLVIVALLLSCFGVAMVYSAGQTDVPSIVARLYRSQLMWLGLAIVVAWVVSRASVRMIEWAAWPAYLLTVALLLLTLVIGSGAGTAASSKSWLTIGGMRIGQPSELAKITVVLMLARCLLYTSDAADD